MSLFSKVKWLVRYGRFFATPRDIKMFLRLLRKQSESGTDVKLKVRRRAGATLICRPKTTDASVLWTAIWGKFHLPTGKLKAKPVIFDLGANVGYTCFDLGTRFPDAQVIGVELDQAQAELAQLNTAVLGSQCQIVHAAIWNKDGQVSYAKTGQEWGYHISTDQEMGAEDIYVRAISIDTLMQEMGIDWIDYMKMDIEGAEATVVCDDAPWLARVSEINLEIHAPATYESCSAILSRAGFTCERSVHHNNAMFAKRARPES